MRELLKDRILLYVVSAIAVFIIFVVFALNLLSRERKELTLLREQRSEMIALSEEFVSLRQKIGFLESKKNMSKIQGIAQAVDEVFLSVGLKDKVKSVKFVGKRETAEGLEEEADIFIEKVTMNEMINIFYKMENVPMLIAIRKSTIKKSFENPELLNISLSLSFLRAK